VPTVTDLIDVLRQRSEDPPAPPPGLDALHRRIGRRRTARWAAGALAIVALTVVAAVPVVVDRGGATGRGTAEPPVNAADRTPLEYTGGYRLADTRVAALPTENTFTYTFTPTSLDFVLMFWCDSDHGSRIRAFVGDKQVLTDYCEPDGRRQPIQPMVYGDQAHNRIAWGMSGVTVDQPVTITARVHAGRDEDPQPATASGTAKLLLYLPVPIADYPFPPAPATIRPFSAVYLPPGQSIINEIEAGQWGNNAYAPLSVVKKPGRHIGLNVELHGPGLVHVYANHVEVKTLACWDWQEGFLYSFTVDPDTVAPEVPSGGWFTVAVRTEYFTAPVWKLVVADVPPAQPGG
jgi:hypothetical protein